MKGISAVIGALVIVLMTIGIASTTYLFVSNTLTSETSNSFELVDSYGDIVTIRNSGTGVIKQFTATLDDQPTDLVVTPSPVPAGQKATVQILGSVISGTHTLRLCTSNTCNVAYITIFEIIKKIITSPATIIPSVIAAGGGGIFFQDSSGNDLAVITDTGKIGIGTTSPDNRMEIELDSATIANTVDIAKFTATSSGIPAAGFGPSILFGAERSDAAETGIARIGAVWVTTPPSAGANEDSALVFQTVSAGSYNERMRINYDGNVGIGTTNPTTMLHIYRNDATRPMLRVQQAAGSNGGLLSLMSNTAEWQMYVQGNDLLFTNPSTTRVAVLSSGNVGIGTASPAQKLEINSGALGFRDSTDTYRYTISPGVGTLRFASSGGTPVTYFDLEPAPQKVAVYVNLLNFRQASTIDTASGDLTISPAGNLNLMPSGNVGIGTTSPTAKLEVDSDSGNAFLVQRTTGGGDIFYIQQGPPNVISMWPDASGNVGIGTTNPSTKLSVVGGVSIGSALAIANRALCWTSDNNIGYCSTQPGVTGACTCNKIN